VELHLAGCHQVKQAVKQAIKRAKELQSPDTDGSLLRTGMPLTAGISLPVSHM
jgi:hypothetical protein